MKILFTCFFLYVFFWFPRPVQKIMFMRLFLFPSSRHPRPSEKAPENFKAACLQNETAPEKLLKRYEKRFEKREKRSEKRSETRLKNL